MGLGAVLGGLFSSKGAVFWGEARGKTHAFSRKGGNVCLEKHISDTDVGYKLDSRIKRWVLST